MEKRNLIVAINGMEMMEKLVEDEARVLLSNIHDSFVINMGDLQKRFGFTESYTKEEIANGVWKYTFTINGKHNFYIYLSGTDSIPVLPHHEFYAEVEIKEIGKTMKCVFCDSKEDLEVYKSLTEKSIKEYEGYDNFGEHFNMSYSA